MPAKLRPLGGRVRGGGYRSPEGYVFELTGGALCLDLVNTVDNRPTEARELLVAYADVLAWARQTSCLDRATLATLDEEGRNHPRAAATALRHIREVREVLFSIFAALADGREGVGPDLERYNAELRAQMPNLTLAGGRSAGFGWRWELREGRALDALLGPVLWSAAQLLTSSDLGRARRCAAINCDWLFLDHSKNASRRWCDMTVCGNRSKARRHYLRSRKAARGVRKRLGSI